MKLSGNMQVNIQSLNDALCEGSGMKAKKSVHEETFAKHVRAYKLTDPVRELKFHPIRKWRFDFSWPDKMIAVEIEGGTWSGGRHTTGAGFESDCEKYNEATALGWAVYRFTGSMIKSGVAILFVSKLFQES